MESPLPAHSPDQTMVATASTFDSVLPAMELREHYLVMVAGVQPGLRVRVGLNPLRLGRREPCDVVLPDTQVSGAHCELSARFNQADLLVADMGSTNGSFVDEKRITAPQRLRPGALLRVGAQIFRHDYAAPSDVLKAQELDRDLEKARRYVLALLPAPIAVGPVQTDWHYQPSTELGGDAFGLNPLSAHCFAGYLIDVSGHGVGAAMHSVSVMNVMRQRALPQTDFHDPSQVLRSLNDMFQMDSHDGMYFSMWYGVYDVLTRTLRYASAGHHPSYLVDAARSQSQPLQTRNLVIGAMPGLSFTAASTQVAPGSTLYVFSDGVFEVSTQQGTQWGLPDFLPLLTAPTLPGSTEPERLHQAVRQIAKPGPLEDDFSLLTVTFT